MNHGKRISDEATANLLSQINQDSTHNANALRLDFCDFARQISQRLGTQN